jgi:4-amino-4-deoxy-L-arabinose transferase-like glycosyltransferase
MLLTLLEKRSALIAAGVVFTLCVGGLIYAAMLGDRVRYPDEREYLTLAAHVRDGRGFTLNGVSPSAYRAPVYPLCLSVITDGGLLAQRGFNFVCLGLSAGLLYLTIRRVASPVAGSIAALLTLAYPVLFYTAGTFYPQTLAGALFMAIVYLLFGCERTSIGHSALVGLLFGALLLTVPAFIFVLGCTMLWMLRRRTLPALAHVATVGAVALLVLLPWAWRNTHAFGTPVLLGTNMGVAFYTGVAPDAGANTGVNIDYARHRGATAGMNEAQRNAYYLQAGWRAIQDDPPRALRLSLAKFLNHFNYRNELFTVNESHRTRDRVMLVTYGGLLLLVLVRLGMTRRKRLTEFERAALALYLLNAAFAALFITRIRLRLPFDWLLLGVAAITLAELLAVPTGPLSRTAARARAAGLRTEAAGRTLA